MLGNEDAEVLLGLKDLNRAFFVRRSNDDLGEDVLDLLGHLDGDLAVDGDDAAECGERIARMRGAVCRSDGLIRHGDTARVGVLDDGNARTLVIPCGAPRGVSVLVVVVGHLLAVQLLRVSQALAGAIAGNGRGLVGVLAVAQGGGSAFAAELIDEPLGNSGIVISGVQECIACQATALLQGEAALLCSLCDVAVTRRIDDDGNGWVILRCRTNHGWASDVDLLNAAIEVRAGSNGLTEWVQVHYDQLECLHTELF